MPKIIASSILAVFIFLLLWFNMEARSFGEEHARRENRAVIGPGGVDRPGIGPGGTESPGIGPGGVDRPGTGPGGTDRSGVGPGGVDRPGIGPGGVNPRPIQRTSSSGSSGR